MEPWYWVIIIGVLVIFYVLLNVRQKRQEKQNLEMLNSFRVGDKVITHIGIYGKIKKIHNTSYGKVCTLEIGTTNKIDIEMDLRYIAGLDEKTAVPDEPKTETKVEEKTQEVEHTNNTQLETKEEQPQNSKKTKKSKK